MSELKKWDLPRIQSVLANAREAAAEGAESVADRILQHGQLREGLDWLVTQHYKTKRTEAKLITLAHGVLAETKLFPPSGDPASEDKHYSVAHLGRFDVAIRALKDFVDKLAARAAKE